MHPSAFSLRAHLLGISFYPFPGSSTTLHTHSHTHAHNHGKCPCCQDVSHANNNIPSPQLKKPTRRGAGLRWGVRGTGQNTQPAPGSPHSPARAGMRGSPGAATCAWGDRASIGAKWLLFFSPSSKSPNVSACHFVPLWGQFLEGREQKLKNGLWTWCGKPNMFLIANGKIQ